MRLSIAVNDQPVCRASLANAGWLSAHVNLSQGLQSDEPDRVWAVTHDISETPNSTTQEWEGGPLVVGDRILIEILPEGASDPPTYIRHGAASPRNLFSDVAQARQLLAAVQTCDRSLTQVLERAGDGEPPAEFEKVRQAVAEVLWELDAKLIEPTLRRHPELLAEAEQLKIR